MSDTLYRGFSLEGTTHNLLQARRYRSCRGHSAVTSGVITYHGTPSGSAPCLDTVRLDPMD